MSARSLTFCFAFSDCDVKNENAAVAAMSAIPNGFVANAAFNVPARPFAAPPIPANAVATTPFALIAEPPTLPVASEATMAWIASVSAPSFALSKPVLRAPASFGTGPMLVFNMRNAAPAVSTGSGRSATQPSRSAKIFVAGSRTATVAAAPGTSTDDMAEPASANAIARSNATGASVSTLSRIPPPRMVAAWAA